MSKLILEEFNLENAERRLCAEALHRGGNIVNAARLLGITRHALKRRIIKLGIAWVPGRGVSLEARPNGAVLPDDA